MSTGSDRGSNRERPSLYAPRWADSEPSGGAHDERSGDDGFAEDAAFATEPALNDNDAENQGVVIERFRVPRSLEPTMLPQARREFGARSILGMWGRLGAAVAGAAIVALFVIGRLPAIGTPERVAVAAPAPLPTRSVATEPPAPPQLIVVTGAPRVADDSMPLGISLRDAGIGASVVISGLQPGMSITTGRPLDVASWRLAPGDLGNALVRPPRDFVGTIELAAELRRLDDMVVDRKTQHLQWVAPPRRNPPAPAVRRLDAEEIAALIKRGEEFVANGDLAAARLMLQRAAEAQDARAALALAATYDPSVLAQLGIRGPAGDAAMARAWYEKAKEFGSDEASRRLELLASTHR
jgi:hypothetical protein